MKVVLSKRAISRIEEIEDYVADRNPAAGARLRLGILERIASLESFPRRGHPIPERPDGPYRELLEGGYRIVYQVRRDTVEVVTVLQGRRLLPREDVP